MTPNKFIGVIKLVRAKLLHQPSLLSGAKNEGCRDKAKGEVGLQLELFTKAVAWHAFSSKTKI